MSQCRIAIVRKVSKRLLLDFDAFFVDHPLCGELDAGVDGPIVRFVCECSANIARRADDRAGFARDSRTTLLR